ncbi:MAG: hypothetical protein OES79_09290 [Planctomycetota bacterium]|nr:hypothetical protein [Planctomycetota bacterium]
MRAEQIEIGGAYLATVSKKTIPVTVLDVEEKFDSVTGRPCPVWHCRDTETGRTIVIRSPDHFWQAIDPPRS